MLGRGVPTLPAATGSRAGGEGGPACQPQPPLLGSRGQQSCSLEEREAQSARPAPGEWPAAAPTCTTAAEATGLSAGDEQGTAPPGQSHSANATHSSSTSRWGGGVGSRSLGESVLDMSTSLPTQQPPLPRGPTAPGGLSRGVDASLQPPQVPRLGTGTAVSISPGTPLARGRGQGPVHHVHRRHPLGCCVGTALALCPRTGHGTCGPTPR